MPSDEADRLFAPFRADPASAGLFTDFDGTLAAIVDDPLGARPVAGAMEALAAAAATLGRVAIVSGRPVQFLERFVPAGVRVSGLYGLESLVGGRHEAHPDAERWRPVVEAAATAADRLVPPGVEVERKGLSVTLHFRTQADEAAAVAHVATQIAASTGLAVHEARMSLELRAPIDVDKGTVVSELAAGLAAACFIGDDLGDLAVLDALDALAASGAHTVRVAVRSDECPPELLARADLVVDGPAAVVELIASLAP